MGNTNKIKALLKKIVALLIKNKSVGAIESSEALDEEIVQTITDIKAGKYSNILKDIDTEKDWKILKRKKQRSERSSTYLSMPLAWQTGSREFWTYGVAASIVLLISITLVFKKTNQAPVIVNNKIESGTDEATLTLEDGSKVVLEKGAI